jgi:hypothetical protein
MSGAPLEIVSGSYFNFLFSIELGLMFVHENIIERTFRSPCNLVGALNGTQGRT